MRCVAAALLVSATCVHTWSLPRAPAAGRSRVSAVMADTAAATVGQAVVSDWDSKKPVHVSTWVPKSADLDISNKQWWVVDAEGMRLGRMCTEIAKLLIGKHKVTYYPGADVGDYVVVVNADKVVVSGAKAKAKTYFRHSGRPGGVTTETFAQLQARIPERIVEKAVKGMLPKGALGREQFRHLKVYAGPEHPHEAQSPLKCEWPEGHIAITPPSGKKMKVKVPRAKYDA